jgi:CheY-like chemotaxis protein
MSVPAGQAILYAEDDPDDRLLAELAHRDSGAVNPLNFVRDGDEVLEYLRHTGRHQDVATAPQPGIILLDLNMPGTDGREALRMIRADPGMRRIPVVILTTSRAQGDIAASYDAGANSYIVKPSSFANLVHLFESVCDYWFQINSIAKEITR